MKKRLLLFTLTLLLISGALPVCALAFGGFVSPKGSGTYHEVYCYLVEGYSLNELFWYDSPSQAKSAGLTPCNECDAANGREFSYDLDTYWKTDNHLFQSALEMAYEDGYEFGYDNGYAEGYYDVDSDALMSYYDAGYNEGYDIGRQSGYDAGYDDGQISVQNKVIETTVIQQEETSQNESTSSDTYAIIFFVMFLIMSILYGASLHHNKQLESELNRCRKFGF